MKILSKKELFFKKGAVLTIGMFDGVHAGHQMLLHYMKKKNLPTLLVTFYSHPYNFFSPEKSKALLTTFKQRCSLLEKAKLDAIYPMEFTKQLAQTSYKDFILDLHQKTHFSYLILGKGACFGAHQEGNEEKVRALSKESPFEVEYIPPLIFEEEPLSSSRVRTSISKGDLLLAEKMLKRPYSLMIEKDKSFFDLGYLLPPKGNYPVIVRSERGEEKTLLTVVDPQKRVIELKNYPNLSLDLEIIFESC